MARTRSIKPGFFTNEILAALPYQDRLLFAGLWTIADREGRLEDRPLRIRAELFPYATDMDIHGSLDRLVKERFLHRYVTGDSPLIQIINFVKHQAPHHTEKASVLPAPLINREITDNVREDTVDILGSIPTSSPPSTLPPLLPSTLPPGSMDTAPGSTPPGSYEDDFRAGLLAKGFGNPDLDPGVEVMIERTAAVCCQAGADPRLGAWVVVDLLSTQRCRGKPLEYLLGALRSQLNTAGANGHGLRKAGA